MSEDVAFEPKWASPPGESILDAVEARRMSLRDLEGGISAKPGSAQRLLRGEIRITPKLASQLAGMLGGSAEFWLRRDSQFVADLAKMKNEAKGWLRALPLADMVRLGWVALSEDFDENRATCMKFFGVSSVDEWRDTWLSERSGLAAFRTSPVFESEVGPLAVWLRQGEIESAAIKCNVWTARRFEGALRQIRNLTRTKDPKRFLPELKGVCAECGVAVVVVRAPKGCRASGATRFVTQDKAILQLSFRYLSDDQFWFTFFHEAAHLILHGKQLFMELETALNSSEESEANDFAARTLIPDQFGADLASVGSNPKRVIRFARELGIAPGIVVGQLQHRGLLPRNRLNSLKRRFTWL